MTAFEQGYEAFLKGVGKDDNPFDDETCPKSRVKWDKGWIRAQANRRLHA
jgi:ribosome modulation factor